MKVLLLNDVPKQGRRGEVKEVSEGFARNFLLPKKLAVVATVGRLREQAVRDAAGIREQTREITRGQRVWAQLHGKIVAMSARASPSGTLYQGVGIPEIARLLQQQGFHVLESEVELAKPLKRVGEHEVSVRLPGRECQFILQINKSS